MSPTVPTEWTADASPAAEARLAGLFYLLTTLTGVAGLVMSGKVVVSGDPAATARNLVERESLFRLALAADLVAGACYVVVALLLYRLFQPVNRRVALLSAFFGTMGCTIAALSGVFHLAPMAVLGGPKYLDAFSGEQLQALAYLLLRFREQASSIAFVFFGLYCLLIGYLIFRSTFLPRILGALMAIAGLCWLTGSFASFLSPPLAGLLRPWLLAGGVGEAALTLWLLVRGVNARRWKEQAGAPLSRQSYRPSTLDPVAH